MNGIRTRMAPSPTGEYHIGHIRTVLYNFAFARKHKGSFILRIEDTDQERFVQGATDRILDVIRAYNLDWDEGPRKNGAFGPYIQSQRLPLYKEYAEKLVAKKKAYYCFCTKERLTEMRELQLKQGLSKTMYDGFCRSLSDEEVKKNMEQKLPYVIRLSVPKNEKIEFHDEVYGDLSFLSDDVDDTVLLKSDGYPTYHLAVVVDDHLMGISHIMRGNDWLPSTPKHVLLYKAFGWDIPHIIHLPNLKEKGENRKLSKRYGAVFAIDFLKEGYLVDALLNFLMFLGWNPGNDQEIMSLEQFISDFDLKRIHKTDLVAFDREKLLWMNGYYIRNMSKEVLLDRLLSWSKEFEIPLNNVKSSVDFDLKVISLIQDRLRTLADFNNLTHYFYRRPNVDNLILGKFTDSQERKNQIISGFLSLLTSIEESDWHTINIEDTCHAFIQKNNFKPKEAFMTLRVAITGESATPPIFDILSVLGKEEVIKRLEKL